MALTAADVRGTRFAVSSRFKRGYATVEVDRFVEQIAERLETGEGLSSNDVYHVRFSKAAMADHGYAERGVDSFLEQIHTELLTLEDAWGRTDGPDGAGAPRPSAGTTPDSSAADAEHGSQDDGPTAHAP